MRNKSYPYFEDWPEMWGNDGATGEFAETAAEAVEEMNRETSESLCELEAFLYSNGLDDIDELMNQDTKGKKKKVTLEGRK